MKLFYDTETAGLPKDGYPDDHPLQPHLVQLAAALFDNDGREISCVNLVVRPEGWTIPAEAVKSHGITTERAKVIGVPLKLVVACFTNLRALADEEVAHNIQFDDKIMRYAIARCGVSKLRFPEKRTCTMTIAAPIVNLPPTAKMLAAGRDHPKSPSLTECHQFFFGEAFSGAHDAMNDVRALVRCYYHIQNTGGTPFVKEVA